jgi:hypothetical protein
MKALKLYHYILLKTSFHCFIFYPYYFELCSMVCNKKSFVSKCHISWSSWQYLCSGSFKQNLGSWTIHTSNSNLWIFSSLHHLFEMLLLLSHFWARDSPSSFHLAKCKELAIEVKDSQCSIHFCKFIHFKYQFCTCRICTKFLWSLFQQWSRILLSCDELYDYLKFF